MPKTPDEIKKGLECCAASYADCHKECPYKPDCDGSQILKDSLALIQQLQAENAKKDETIQMLQDGNASLMRMIDEECEKNVKLEAERDALYEEVRRCFYCIHVAGVLGECDQHCESCNADCPCKECDHYNKFEWRGVQKEE